MKYAIIPICSKFDDDGNVISRSVLISYKKVKKESVITVYQGTKLVATDDYFKDENSSHIYQFYDDGFALVDCKYPDQKARYKQAGVLNKVRPYHTIEIKYVDTTIRFRARDDQAALKKFKERGNK